MNPGDRFHAWTKGCRVRELHPNVAYPNRRGVARIEHDEMVAAARMACEGVKPDLVRDVVGIGESVR